MKIRVLLLGLLLQGFCFAEMKVHVKPASGQALYHAGETAAWDVSLEKDGTPFSGVMNYRILEGGRTVVKTGSLPFEQGDAVVEATRTTPGWLLMELLPEWAVDESERVHLKGGAVFDYPAIKSVSDEPADFDRFWQEKLEELADVPMNPKLEKVDHPTVDLWKIELDNIGNTKIYGYFARPKNSSEKLPAIASFDGAGVRAATPKYLVQQAEKGWLVLNVIAHSIDPDREREYYENLQRKELKEYWKIGNDNPDTCYFLRMFLATSRVMDYLASRPDWNGEVLCANGSSQGGWQALAATMLNPNVTHLFVNVPAGCDQLGALFDREPGWPKTFGQSESSQKAAGYYDSVNFARRIHCPVLVGAGAIDQVCPAEGVALMFNQLQGPKHFVVAPEGTHMVGHRQYWDLHAACLNALKHGTPLPWE